MADISATDMWSAANRPDVVEAMRKFYQALDRRVEQHQPTCWNRAQCCQFGSYGHRLYVTTLEVAYYLATGTTTQPAIPPIVEDTCPHAIEGKCHARERRPMGCRIFYCDPNAQTWQGPLTEAQLKELRDLHETLNVPYVYADWMNILNSLANNSGQDQSRYHGTSWPIID